MLNIFQTFQDLFSMINSVIMPTGNLGIMRSQMPQIDGQHQSAYIKWLGTKGITTKRAKVPVIGLKLTQNEINKSKVFKLMQTYRSGELSKWAPIIVSSDGFVIDGSHRFVAVYNIDKYLSMDAIVVDCPALKLVRLSALFQHVKYRNHSDSSVKV